MALSVEPATMRATPPLSIHFCAWPVAGIRTQYENVRAVTSQMNDLAIRFTEINPYKAGGLIERLPLLGHRTKGSLRSFVSSLPLYTSRPNEVIWSQVDTAIFPFLMTKGRFAHIPVAISTDATIAQMEAMAEYQLADPARPISFKHRLRNWILSYTFRHASLVLPWSRWAGDAIAREYGVAQERIHVVPPGVDLTRWHVPPAGVRGARPGRPTRLLFVGGDFARKGGPLLLQVFRTALRRRAELHLVTKEPVDPEPGVFVYPDFGPNDPGLLQLYETADALVLPTRADCFSLASIEAMACGLPVITCPVGGIPEIVEHGASGWLVPVGDGAALLAAIETVIAGPDLARAMGLRGRGIVEERFDVERNTRHAFDLLRSLADPR